MTAAEEALRTMYGIGERLAELAGTRNFSARDSPVTSIHDRLRTPPNATDFGLRELMAVREIVHAFLTAERPEDVYQFALDRVSPLVGATFACVYLIDEGSELMRLAAVHNWPERYARVPRPDARAPRLRAERRSGERAAHDRSARRVRRSVARGLAGGRDRARLPIVRRAAAADGDRSMLGTVTFYFASPKAVAAETRHLHADGRRPDGGDGREGALDRGSAQGERGADARRTRSSSGSTPTCVEARRSRTSSSSNISHELRTPLTAVIGYISLMQDGLAGPITGEQQQTLEQVKDASEQLLTLIGDLLELTALKRGALDAVVTDVDPRDPLRDAVAAARGRREHGRARGRRAAHRAVDAERPADDRESARRR